MDSSMASNQLPPPGFRFRPTKTELINDYLKPKTKGYSKVDDFIATVDIYECEPCDLPYQSKMPWDEKKWYFFCHLHRLQGKGKRYKRKTKTGFWKSTCEEMKVFDKGTNECIGSRRILVFRSGTSPGRSDWVIHEYALSKLLPDESDNFYVICCLKKNKKKSKKINNKVDPRESAEGESNGEISSDKIPSSAATTPWDNSIREWSPGLVQQPVDSPFGDGDESSGNITFDGEIAKAPATTQEEDFKWSPLQPLYSAEYDYDMLFPPSPENSHRVEFDDKEDSPTELASRLFPPSPENSWGTHNPFNNSGSPKPWEMAHTLEVPVSSVMDVHQPLEVVSNSS